MKKFNIITLVIAAASLSATLVYASTVSGTLSSSGISSGGQTATGTISGGSNPGSNGNISGTVVGGSTGGGGSGGTVSGGNSVSGGSTSGGGITAGDNENGMGLGNNQPAPGGASANQFFIGPGNAPTAHPSKSVSAKDPATVATNVASVVTSTTNGPDDLGQVVPQAIAATPSALADASSNTPPNPWLPILATAALIILAIVAAFRFRKGAGGTQ